MTAPEARNLLWCVSPEVKTRAEVTMSVCCAGCFDDPYLKAWIDEHGEVDDCEHCYAEEVACVDSSDLKDFFEPVVELYKLTIDFMPGDALSEREPVSLVENLNDDWAIFAVDQPERLLGDILGYEIDITEDYMREGAFWGDDVENDHQLATLWEGFRQQLLEENRFFLDHPIDTLQEALELRERSIPVGEVFFRARRGEHAADKMGMPPREKAIPGRANPRGIPYLYAATDSETALREVRASNGEFVTVARLTATTELHVINLVDRWIESPFQWGYRLRQIMSNLSFLLTCPPELVHS
jgi:hypothetical protein